MARKRRTQMDCISLSITEWFQNLKDDFLLNFVEEGRYMYIVKGLGITLEVTFFATLIGILLA